MTDLTASAQTLLAFDYGSKKIGIAAGQRITGTASAIGIVIVKDNKPDWEQLEMHIKQWRPDAFVVGMPFNMDGSDSEMTKKVRKFADQLSKRFSKPVFEADERLSTREAREISRDNAQRHGKRFNDRAQVDALAAQLILESWLNDN